jgi:hypothetical protein
MPSKDVNFSLSVQIVILFIAIILFIIYYYRIFALEKHNRLALAFSIVTFLWFASITLRYLYNKQKCKKEKKFILVDIPHCIKCTIGDKNCETGNIEIWGIFHFIIYMLIGLFIPDCYIEIIIISVVCELLETAVGHTSKYIVDPLINMSGYIIGSAFARCYYKRINSLTRCQIVN